jgi:3-oxoacyl-[acyl-carrier protein] reductase
MPVALITGASRGLGRQIALALSENGYSVSVNYRSSSAKAAQLMEKTGRSSVALRADVGDSRQVRAIAEEIKREFGRLDVIINNAGITKDHLLLKQTELEWDSVIRTNLTGCFNVIRTLSPLMIESGGGHIINISSYSGLKGQAGQAAYSASKSALLGLTISAAQELSEYNIRVNAVLPGYMMTEMGAGAQKALEKVKNMSILKKLSQPREVADFILQLVKTENISGQIFNLDSRII